MNNSSIHQPNLDIIALEAKHQKDFERSLEVQEFSKNYRDELRISFEDGKYDGELDLEPEPIGYADSPLLKATSERRERSMVQPCLSKGLFCWHHCQV